MNKTLQIKICSLEIPVGMEHVALLQLSIGPMSLIHPVYISLLNSIPLLIGKDLLNRFEPLIDFQRLKIWAQVQEPLPLVLAEPPETKFHVMSTNLKIMALHGDTEPQELHHDPGRQIHDHAAFLCSFEPASENRHYFDEDTCQGMITAYVDGCSYNHQGVLKAGAGSVWLDDNRGPPQQVSLDLCILQR